MNGMEALLVIVIGSLGIWGGIIHDRLKNTPNGDAYMEARRTGALIIGMCLTSLGIFYFFNIGSEDVMWTFSFIYIPAVFTLIGFIGLLSSNINRSLWRLHRPNLKDLHESKHLSFCLFTYGLIPLVIFLGAGTCNDCFLAPLVQFFE